MTATLTQVNRARQRAKVRHLAGRGLSNRVIAGKAGVSESTVRRWRADDAPHRAAAPAIEAPAAPPDVLTVPYSGPLRDDLAVLAAAGLDEQRAVGLALRFLADAIEDAWAHQVCPRGVIPLMRVQSVPPTR